MTLTEEIVMTLESCPVLVLIATDFKTVNHLGSIKDYSPPYVILKNREYVLEIPLDEKGIPNALLDWFNNFQPRQVTITWKEQQLVSGSYYCLLYRLNPQTNLLIIELKPKWAVERELDC